MNFTRIPKASEFFVVLEHTDDLPTASFELGDSKMEARLKNAPYLYTANKSELASIMPTQSGTLKKGAAIAPSKGGMLRVAVCLEVYMEILSRTGGNPRVVRRSFATGFPGLWLSLRNKMTKAQGGLETVTKVEITPVSLMGREAVEALFGYDPSAVRGRSYRTLDV